MKPSIPKGTRDFGPEIMVKRNYIFNTIENVFQLYGYQPLETPAMESLNTLLGKYGEEGDKLLFKVLNSGDFLAKANQQDLVNGDSKKVVEQISEKGLRYDLTVPFARYVVQHRNEITFPFKRYQVQPVWRADKPQKGRYREFYQCDADVIGSDSLLNEVELLRIMDEGFRKLGISVTVHMNNRKILSGIAEWIGHPDKITDITVAIDKLEKIGLEKVKEELSEKGIDNAALKNLEPVLRLSGDNREKIRELKSLLKDSETGMRGMDEVTYIMDKMQMLDLKADFNFNITLARGLDYYTGAIFEVTANDTQMGSICGGGRYDDLTGVFGLKDVSGVGISFGADRIYDVMNAEDLFPKEVTTTTHVLFVNFGEKETDFCLPVVEKLRKAGVATEIFPQAAKMKKQMTYANNKGIPYVALVGEEELNNGQISLKNMASGQQTRYSPEELVKELAK
ncbi:MAG: histidine--tRNA ligase [Bacteroidales bacterium]|nr:histidine--tRNA ligase [Bacteroidales bacterium]MCF8333943.1 histidine--tRNA ligase [Bacteroidales bacterium]